MCSFILEKNEKKTGVTIAYKLANDTMKLWGGSFSDLAIRAEIEVIGLSCNCRGDDELKY